MTYFESCKTLDELKKAYKALAMKHHPDVGGPGRAPSPITCG